MMLQPTSQPTAEAIAYDVAAAARVVGLSRSFLYLAHKAGELPFVKIGRGTLVMRSDLESWLLSHRVAYEVRGA